MNRLLVTAIALAVAPASLAAAEPDQSQTAEPDQSQTATPPANCPYAQDGQAMPMRQSGGPNAMQHQMGDGTMGNGAMNGQGHMMQGQAMPHGNQSAMGMGQGQPQGMMQGDGQCPVLNQQKDAE